MAFAPRQYQSDAVEAVWDALGTATDHPLVVAPTGSGKSIIIAMLADKVVQAGGKVIVAAHRKELLTQNREAYRTVSGREDAGYYSAGLGERDTESNVVFAGIQSAYKRAHEFGDRKLLIIDECHRLKNDSQSQYGRFVSELEICNEWHRVVGLTATPFRTDGGCLVKSGLFGGVVAEVELFDLLDHDPPVICKLISTIAEASVDVKDLQIVAGEYTQNSQDEAFGGLVESATKEIVDVAASHARKSIIVFGVSVSHSERIANLLRSQTGEEVAEVYGSTPPIIREANLRRFKSGDVRWLVNCNVLTEGFDSHLIDMVAVVRATTSPGLFAQAVGRGMRPREGKSECIVLDFGGNISRHGSITDKHYGRRPKKSTEGEGVAPYKECPGCGSEVPLATVSCLSCGHVFESAEKPSHDARAERDLEIMASMKPRSHRVYEMVLARWKGKVDKQTGEKKPDTLRVDYVVEEPTGGDLAENYRIGNTVSEWVCVEHTGYARKKAAQWWAEFSLAKVPDSIDGCLDAWNTHQMRVPVGIKVRKDRSGFDRILNREFDEPHPQPDEWVEPKEVIDVFEDDEIPF